MDYEELDGKVDKLTDALMSTEAMKKARQQGTRTEAEPIAPELFQAYMTNCLTKFTLGHYAESVKLAQQLFLQKPTHFMAQIMIISMQRCDEIDANAAQFMGLVALRALTDSWHKDLMQVTLGLVEPAAVLANATDDQKRCEAHFYIGQRLLTLGQKESAQAAFDLAAKSNTFCLKRALLTLRPTSQTASGPGT